MGPDRLLVKAVLGGDRAAYGELVRRYERSVRGVVLGVLGNHHATEDAGQDVFVMAYEKLGQLRDGARFGPWVMKIAHRHAVRLAKERRGDGLQPLQHEPAAGGRDGQLDESNQRLLAAVGRLPRHEQTMILLRHFGGHSMREIAAMTERPIGTVTKRLSRAHARLRAWLGEEDES